LVRFEWDQAKAASNVHKHGVRFDDAILAFGDRFALFEQDRMVGEELRWQMLFPESQLQSLGRLPL